MTTSVFLVVHEISRAASARARDRLLVEHEISDDYHPIAGPPGELFDNSKNVPPLYNPSFWVLFFGRT